MNTFFGKQPKVTLIWRTFLLFWFIVTCTAPAPLPLGAGKLLVGFIDLFMTLPDNISATIAAVALRCLSFSILGLLLVQSLRTLPRKTNLLLCLITAPIIITLSLWIYHSHFPVPLQLWLGVISGEAGVLAAFALKKSKSAFLSLLFLLTTIFIWATSTGISDDLYENAKAASRHLLQAANDIPDGDRGFEILMEKAFAFAQDNTREKAVEPNKAAILALGFILGEEKIAKVAKRELNLKALPKVVKLRNRITAYKRGDLSRHFWVSAALAVLSSDKQSIRIGIMKEIMDSNGGSGFSFVDLTANLAGIRFTESATRSSESAKQLQQRISEGVKLSDFMPNPLDLPENIELKRFKEEYGGLGGAKTNELVKVIEKRMESCIY